MTTGGINQQSATGGGGASGRRPAPEVGKCNHVVYSLIFVSGSGRSNNYYWVATHIIHLSQWSSISSPEVVMVKVARSCHRIHRGILRQHSILPCLAEGTGFMTSKTQATNTPYPGVMFQSAKMQAAQQLTRAFCPG